MSSIYRYYTIYQITNLLNKKQYIGCHKTNSFKSKKTQDYNQKYSSNKELNSDLKKYGHENFIREWLFIFNNEQDMLNKEYELVNEEWYKSDMTYNKTRGGGNPPMNRMVGEYNPRYNKKFPEHSERMKKMKNNVKLTREQVYHIKYNDLRLWQWGGVSKIAEEYGLIKSTISHIKYGRTWKDV